MLVREVRRTQINVLDNHKIQNVGHTLLWYS